MGLPGALTVSLELRCERGVKFVDELFCSGPVDAAIGDGNAVTKFLLGLRKRLVPDLEVALEHCPHDGRVAGDDLRDERADHLGLALRLLCRVVVRTVDENGRASCRERVSLNV